jgi:hypothetical protein
MDYDDKEAWLDMNGDFFNAGYNSMTELHTVTWAPHGVSDVFRQSAGSLEELIDKIYEDAKDNLYWYCIVVEDESP